MSAPGPLRFELSAEAADVLVDAVVERALPRLAELLADSRPAAAVSPFLTVAEAAEYLRAKPQRVYDLLSSGRLSRYKDGSRVLVARAEIDTMLTQERTR